MNGSCDGCPSSAVTVQLAVERAIHEAAPEIVIIEVERAVRSRGRATPVDARRASRSYEPRARPRSPA